MPKLSEDHMAHIATQAWFGYDAAYTARKLALPLATVKAYRVSPACIARLMRISAYYAQQAAQAEQENAS